MAEEYKVVNKYMTDSMKLNAIDEDIGKTFALKLIILSR
jgi:hypothetical protein